MNFPKQRIGNLASQESEKCRKTGGHKQLQFNVIRINLKGKMINISPSIQRRQSYWRLSKSTV